MILSLIVPVYNVESCLEKCLGSLMLQGVESEDFEVIAVNDGSTDASESLLARFDWGDLNHRIISQENSGLSVARNVGLQAAVGDYVWFIDSDDWIDPNCAPDLFESLCGCDIVYFSSHYQINGTECGLMSTATEDAPGKEFSIGPFFHGAPFYVFRKQFLLEQNLSFYPGIAFEDSHFIPRALYLANNVKVFKKPMYYYCVRQGSITRSAFSQNKLNSFAIVITELQKFQETVVAQGYQKRWSSNIAELVNHLAKTACLSSDRKLTAQAADFLNDRTNVESLRFSKNLNTRIWYWCGRLFGDRFFNVYRFLFKFRY